MGSGLEDSMSQANQWSRFASSSRPQEAVSATSLRCDGRGLRHWVEDMFCRESCLNLYIPVVIRSCPYYSSPDQIATYSRSCSFFSANNRDSTAYNHGQDCCSWWLRSYVYLNPFNRALFRLKYRPMKSNWFYRGGPRGYRRPDSGKQA